MENGLHDKNSTQFCLDISTLYGEKIHNSYSTEAIKYTEEQIEFDNECYYFDCVKPEHFLQITLIALRNYTTGYGISPQSLGVLKIPIERLYENTVC